MAKLEKVIFDTNRLYNKQASSFFAKNLCGLDKFSKIAEIIIPDIVLGELKYKYKREFEEEKEKFFKTILNSFLSHDAKTLDIEDRVENLLTNESINFTKIDLTDFSVLKDMKELALKKEAPFKNGVKEDPGFKDAYIYFTILEYLKNTDDKYIFVCTEDIILKQAFERHSNIKVIKDFDEFRKISNSYFYEDYFINKLKDEILYKDLKKDNIKDIWININGNHVILIEINEEKYLVQIDSGEIVFTVCHKTFYGSIEKLINSDSFGDTFSIVRFLKNYMDYFNDNEIIRMFEAIFNNRQIRGAFHNSVKDFYFNLYENKKELFDDEMKNEIDKLFE